MRLPVRAVLLTPDPNIEAASYIAAMATQPTDARKALIYTLIASLKDAGVWPKLDFLYLLAGHDATAALINAKSPGVSNATAVNSPTFSTDRGYTGNGTTSYLNTNFTPSTAGGAYIQNSAHVGVWSRTDATNDNGVIGGRAVTNTLCVRLILRLVASGNANGVVNRTASGALSVANGNSSGHFVFRRSASNAEAVFRNGVSLGTNAGVSTGVPTVALYVCGENNNGTPIYNTYEVAAAHAGASLTDTDITALYNALQTYMTAVGA